MNIKAKATTDGSFGGTRSTSSSTATAPAAASPSNTVTVAPETTSASNASKVSSSSYSSYLDDFTDYINQAHDYDLEYREWSASEAQKARDWSEQMSNTSYQRAVADLQAAGLNPALAYRNGGADTGSAANASSGGSNTASNLLSTAISSAVSSAIAAQSNATNKELGYANIANSKELAYISGYFGLQSAGTYAGATKYAADQNVASAKIYAAASMYGANKSYDASVNAAASALEGTKYASNSNIYIARFNAQSKADLQMLDDMSEAYIKQCYPQSMWGAINSFVLNASGQLSNGENANLTVYEAYMNMCGQIDSKYGNAKRNF